MAEFYNDVLDIDECVSKIFSNHEIATVEKVCALSSYTEKELQNSVESLYGERRIPRDANLLSYYIEDCWFWKLLYAYKFFKHTGNEERIIDFLNKYNITIEYVDALVRRHPIRSAEFYFFRAALVEYYNKVERKEKESQNEKLSTAYNLDITHEDDTLSNKVNCIKISNRFIRQETLKSLGVHNIEVEIVKEPFQERLTKNIANIDPERLKNIGDDGIIKVGSFVHGGDIIVAKGKPKERNGTCYNTSVILAQTLEGVVIDVQVKSKANGDLLKGKTDTLIQIYLEIQLPVKIGDVLVDKFGNQGVIVGVIDRDDVDLVTNFNFDGSLVRRLDSPCEPHILHARGGVGCQYSEFDDSPMGRGVNAPIVLNKTLVKKFIQSDYFNVLQDVMFIPNGNVRRRIKTVENQAKKVYNICNKNAIVNFVEMGKSVGFDTHIYVLGSNVKEYEEIINDPDLKVEITPITNEKIEEISNGEITRAESFNYRTFERENGGLWDKRIFGRSEEEMRQFMGHLNLPITYLNPLFPQVVLNKLLIYPVRYRWVKTSKSGFIVANWSQDTYVRIINCKKRLENLVKLNSQKIIIENEERRLRENIEGYYTKGVDKYSGLFADYFKRIRDFFTAMPIDYCANMRTSVSLDVPQGTCLIPWKIIDTIFHNKIPTLLFSEMDGDFITKEDELLKSIFGDKIFDQPDEETIKRRKLCQAEKYYKDNQDNSLFVEKVNQYLQNEHIFVTSRSSDGEVIRLIPQATMDENNNSVMVLNPIDYERLSIRIDAPVVVIYDPLDCGSYVEVDTNTQQEFFNFIEILTNDKITNDLLPALFSHWISEVNSKNIVDSLAFCLWTGRRLPQEKNIIDEKPFVEFLYPKFHKESIESNVKNNDDELDDFDFDFDLDDFED